MTFVFSLGGTALVGWIFGVSVLAGGLLMLLNIRWMSESVNRLMGAEKPRADSLTILKYMLRLVLIFGVLFAMIRLHFLSLPGALLGLSVFVLSAMWEAVVLLVREIRRAR